MNLKHVLGEINPERANLHVDEPPQGAAVADLVLEAVDLDTKRLSAMAGASEEKSPGE